MRSRSLWFIVGVTVTGIVTVTVTEVTVVSAGFVALTILMLTIFGYFGALTRLPWGSMGV